MNKPFSMNLSDVIDLPVFSRTRRNHGLEHATLHVLANKIPHTMMAGHSDMGGFWIIGEVPEEAVRDAVDEAISRLRAGESKLAIHPNCGTNFATAGTLAGVAGALAMIGVGKSMRDKLNRLPFATVLATIALMIAQPLGLLVQANVTTSGEPGTLEVTSITPRKQGKMTAYRVKTRG